MNTIPFSMLMHFELDPEEVRLLMRLPVETRSYAALELIRRTAPTNQRLEDFELENLKGAYGLAHWKQVKQERERNTEIMRNNAIPELT